jgi:hypothetical protein
MARGHGRHDPRRPGSGRKDQRVQNRMMLLQIQRECMLGGLPIVGRSISTSRFRRGEGCQPRLARRFRADPLAQKNLMRNDEIERLGREQRRIFDLVPLR